MVNVYLGGSLGKRFGEKWQLLVSSPGEALRAINTNTKGELRKYLGSHGKRRYYKVALGRRDALIESQELNHPSGSLDIYVLPTIRGSNSGAGKIIAGVLLIAATLVISFLSYGTINLEAAAVPAAFGVAGGIAISIGVSLILGGISQLLTPSKQSQGELGSNYFQGSVASASQGGCVPVVYGRGLVSPSTISLWFNNVDYNTTQNQYVGIVERIDLNGGGYEFSPAATTVAVQGSTDSGNTDQGPTD